MEVALLGPIAEIVRAEAMRAPQMQVGPGPEEAALHEAATEVVRVGATHTVPFRRHRGGEVAVSRVAWALGQAASIAEAPALVRDLGQAVEASVCLRTHERVEAPLAAEVAVQARQEEALAAAAERLVAVVGDTVEAANAPSASFISNLSYSSTE